MEELAGTEAGQKLKEAKQWNTALAKAKGEKVKDDLKKLKQTAKRRSHQKKKSSTEWKDRQDAVKQSQAERQDERRRNIAERIRKIKDKQSGKKVTPLISYPSLPLFLDIPLYLSPCLSFVFSQYLANWFSHSLLSLSLPFSPLLRSSLLV
jgi:hypothetical protein